MHLYGLDLQMQTSFEDIYIYHCILLKVEQEKNAL